MHVPELYAIYIIITTLSFLNNCINKMIECDMWVSTTIIMWFHSLSDSMMYIATNFVHIAIVCVSA